MFVKKLKYRLLLTILSINTLMLIVTIGLSTVSLDRGFLDYLNQSQASRAEKLAANLSGYYHTHHSWQRFADSKREWMKYIYRFSDVEGHAKSQFSPDGKEHDTGRLSHRHKQPRPTDLLGKSNTRFLLLDEKKQVIVGPSHIAIEDLVTVAIDLDDHAVGYLGFRQHTELASSIDRLFINQQRNNFIFIALGIFITSIIMAFFIAGRLSRPLKSMAEVTKKIAAGNYQVRATGKGGEELNTLSNTINVLAESLRQSQLGRQRWVADIAHELRTPLAILKGEIEAMVDGVRPMNKMNLESLQQEVSHLTLLVDDLKELSNVDQGALNYQMMDCNVSEILSSVLLLAQQERKAVIDVQYNAIETPDIYADSKRLKQLFSNLLQNTLRYTETGGSLQVVVSVHAETIEVLWQDSSPGVSAQDLPHLTERLYRAENSRNRAFGGSGLGLAIVKSICDGHGFTLTPSHSLLGGLCWQLVIPLGDVVDDNQKNHRGE
ncbi:Signal transduction histidine-protein kinase BaeS [Sinobacterium norvegicum]|uniref:histidine kinase n=1 Tax=Sinobacterium norvegicum TaxID=1641715 RepID=A0ABN8EL09_9GAMM|nr:ATP-binding protein [Sinobacterium norvegicum]CAH0993046.1 Signal transduction histidine-protein kinase BaeS [Sinobacterium norvegicum]